MNDFIILHEYNGKTTYEVLINLNNVSYISPAPKGCWIHFICSLNNGSEGMKYIHITESFEEIKRKLKNFQI